MAHTGPLAKLWVVVFNCSLLSGRTGEYLFFEGRGHCHEEVRRERLAGLALQVSRTLLLTPRIPRAVENHAITCHSFSSEMLCTQARTKEET